MGGNVELIDTLIASQVRAIRWQLALAATLFVVGLCIFAAGTVAQQFNSTFSKSWMVSLFGVFASTLSAFPIKDLILRREKTDALRLLRVRVQNLESQPSVDNEEINKITTMLWGSLKTIIER
jgi:hypothetical protein